MTEIYDRRALTTRRLLPRLQLLEEVGAVRFERQDDSGIAGACRAASTRSPAE